MAKLIRFLKRIRLVYQPSAKLTKIVVVITAAVCLIALLTMQILLVSTEKKNESMRHRAAQLEKVNAQLEKYIGDLGSIDSVIRIAEDELGLLDPTAIIFQPNG